MSENMQALKRVILGWIILMIPWLEVAPVAAMAFDGGDSAEARLFVWSVWTFPISVLAAILLRKVAPVCVLLPILNFIGVKLSDHPLK
jgi:hypothetical protein